MPPWMVKAALQGAISLLPHPERWNGYFQRHTDYLNMSDGYFLSHWRRCERHLRDFQKNRDSVGEFTAIELGTGCLPIVPVGLALCGARQVWSIDMQSLTTAERVMAVFRRYRDLIDRGEVSVRSDGRVAMLREAIEEGSTLTADRLLRCLGITAVVGDVRHTGLAPRSIDLCVSSETFEHIEPDVLTDILRELQRIATPGAVMSHFIDMEDHYASFDRSISVYNFLRYPEPIWRVFNNQLHYVNRLRISDFRDLHESTGWRIVGEEPTSGSREILRKVPLAPEFRRYREDDLLVHAAWITSRLQRD